MNSYAQQYNSPTSAQLRGLEQVSEHRNLAREFLADPNFAIWLKTSRLSPNHEVILRNNEGWGRDIKGLYSDGYWKFLFASDDYTGGMEYKFLLDHEHWMQGPNFRHPGAFTQIISEDTISFPDKPSGSTAPTTVIGEISTPPLGGNFQIWFRTLQYAGQALTLRNRVDGWDNDVAGYYEDGYWKFTFPATVEYLTDFQYKFVLDAANWMKGDNLKFPGRSVLIHQEPEVTFGAYMPRFRHPFERLVVEESVKQQSYIRNHYDETKEFDVIIIGSGMGGGILADALSDRGVDTLVLEAGSLTHESHSYNLPTGEAGPEGARYRVGHYVKRNPDPDYSGFGDEVTMNFGGRSVFWSGLIPQMQAHELKFWPPVIRDYLTGGGYSKAERLMRKFVTFGTFENKLVAAAAEAFRDWQVVHTPRADHQPDLRPKEETPPTSFTRRSTGTFSTADLLLDSLSTRGKGGAEHLYINANHLVTHFEHSGSKVTRVVCEDLVGLVTRRFKAKHFVLAAGSMESVRIAFNSKLDGDHPLIGRGFTDHPSYFVGHDGKDILIPPESPWYGQQEQARIFFYPNEDSPFPVRCNVEINVNGRFWIERHSDDDIQEDHLNSGPGPTVNIKFSFPYPLVETNFIQLGANGGKLEVDVPFMVEDPAWKPAVTALSKEILKFFGVTSIDLSKFMGFGRGGTPHHAGGSMRLGNLGDARVVDTDLKFDNRDNLYACDPSVYPMIPAANPSLTLAALALRLADHLTLKTGH